MKERPEILIEDGKVNVDFTPVSTWEPMELPVYLKDICINRFARWPVYFYSIERPLEANGGKERVVRIVPCKAYFLWQVLKKNPPRIGTGKNSTYKPGLLLYLFDDMPWGPESLGGNASSFHGLLDNDPKTLEALEGIAEDPSKFEELEKALASVLGDLIKKKNWVEKLLLEEGLRIPLDGIKLSEVEFSSQEMETVLRQLNMNAGELGKRKGLKLFRWFEGELKNLREKKISPNQLMEALVRTRLAIAPDDRAIELDVLEGLFFDNALDKLIESAQALDVSRTG